MKKLILLIAGLMVLTTSAFAANTEMNRDQSLIYVGYTPFGIDIPTLFSTPISAGVYLGQNFLVAGDFGIPFDHDFTDSNNNTVNLKYLNMGGYGRWFPGTNSFNIFGGIHQRTLTLTGPVTYTNGGVSATTTVEAKMSAMVADIGIGNQWISDFGLTFGIDWFALRGVLAQTQSVSDSAGFATLPTQAEKDAVQEELKQFNTAFNSLPGLFIISVGWAF